ncbi:heme exporter protein CcmD [Telmatospirillum sp. J64-1]|uniref:heme exporter protein CcmD n=1 Tax=Telmatospirillum sp. J64-1 TaxID=2502183 RepID=UPI00115E4BBE|nr:heme exporter protein CcmD [Telmatospirillum sp. J64-1]
MEQISAFFEMGGYAGFVWPSYVLTAVVMVALLVLSLREMRSNESQLRALEGNRPRGAARRAAARAAEETTEAGQ